MAVEVPPGYEDMEADAELSDRPPHPYRPVEVEGVGPVVFRPPLPAAVPVLAAAVRADTKDDARDNARRRAATVRFLTLHLAPGEWERIAARMLDPDDDLPDDTEQRIVQAIAGWGTARPTVPSATLRR